MHCAHSVAARTVWYDLLTRSQSVQGNPDHALEQTDFAALAAGSWDKCRRVFQASLLAVKGDSQACILPVSCSLTSACPSRLRPLQGIVVASAEADYPLLTPIQ